MWCTLDVLEVDLLNEISLEPKVSDFFFQISNFDSWQLCSSLPARINKTHTAPIYLHKMASLGGVKICKPALFATAAASFAHSEQPQQQTNSSGGQDDDLMNLLDS